MENENAGELRKKVLELIDSMKGKKGAKSEIGRAAETQDWGKLLDLWSKLGDAEAIVLLAKDKIEEEKEG